MPTGEVTASDGWHSTHPTVHNFRQTLLGESFRGRVVNEQDTGGGAGQDTCWFPGSEHPKQEALTGGQWLVGANASWGVNGWGHDSIGWSPAAVVFYRAEQRAPCMTQVPQDMYINRPGSSSYKYVTQQWLKLGINSTSVWSERAGHVVSRPY